MWVDKADAVWHFEQFQRGVSPPSRHLFMPEIITLFRVFLATPSDTVAERGVVEDVLREWNLQHGDQEAARVELISWQTHSYPATGDRPQAIINSQAFDRSDIVIGMFQGRFGSPTGIAESGTVEEIRRGIAQRKQVMVYFSQIPIPGAKRREHSKIEKFRKELEAVSLYSVYTDERHLEKTLRNHLALAMRDLLAKRKISQS